MSTHQFRENGSHYNGGKVFFGYGYMAVGEPRLRMIRKWYRQGAMRGKTKDSFQVDGQPVVNYEAAVEALKTPPVFTPEEIAALRAIGDDPAKHQEIDWEVCYGLCAKGAIEYGPPGACRRTSVGRQILVRAEILSKVPEKKP